MKKCIQTTRVTTIGSGSRRSVAAAASFYSDGGQWRTGTCDIGLHPAITTVPPTSAGKVWTGRRYFGTLPKKCRSLVPSCDIDSICGGDHFDNDVTCRSLWYRVRFLKSTDAMLGMYWGKQGVTPL